MVYSNGVGSIQASDLRGRRVVESLYISLVTITVYVQSGFAHYVDLITLQLPDRIDQKRRLQSNVLKIPCRLWDWCGYYRPAATHDRSWPDHRPKALAVRP